MGWKIVKESSSLTAKKNVNILWVDTSEAFRTLFHHIQPWQCVNHFPGMTNIARKVRLAQNLEFMKKKFRKDYSFFPRTYVLPRDYLAFKKKMGPKGISKSTYILKPDGGAQGKGIFLTRKIDDIDQGSPYVAQSYISNPLLIDNKKFDLRVYVLMTSCNPLRLYLFRDGLVRICTEDFVKPNSKNLHERCMHLTNYSINRHSTKFERDEGFVEDKESGSTGSKRSIKWLLNWLKGQKGEAKINQMWLSIGDICAKTILSILPVLVREYSSAFGVDNMLKQRQSKVLNLNISNQESHAVDDEKNKTKQRGKNKECSKVTTGIEGSVLLSDEHGHESETKTNLCKTTKNTEGGKENVEPTIETFEPNPNVANPNDETDDVLLPAFDDKEDIHRSRCVQVLGFDILIDDKLRPYLIEVNHLPSFETDSDIDKQIKSRVISQAMSIMKARPDDRHKYERKKKKECEKRLFGNIGVRDENCSNNEKSFNARTPSLHATGKSEIGEKRRQRASYPTERLTTIMEIKNTCEKEEKRSETEEKVCSLYALHAPHKLDKVPFLMSKYKGNEEWLLQQIVKKYTHSNDMNNKEEIPIAEDQPIVAQKSSLDDKGAEYYSIVRHDDDVKITEMKLMKAEDINYYTATELLDGCNELKCKTTNLHLANDNTVGGCSDDDDESDDSDENTETSSLCSEDGDYTADDQDSLAKYDEHPIFCEEEELLFDYDKIYPISRSKSSRRIPDYKEMEKYVYKEDLRQQMRMTCPLHQSRSIDECDFEIDNTSSIRNESTSYSFCRSDSWINGNVHLCKPMTNPLKPIPVPSTKQIEAADRLSKGFSVSTHDTQKKHHNSFHTGKRISISLGGNNDDDDSGCISRYPSGTKQHIRRMSESKKGSFAQRKSNGVLVRPVNFEFGGEFVSPFEGRLCDNNRPFETNDGISFLNFVSSAEFHDRNFH